MSRPRVVGVDLSLTSTGVATYGDVDRIIPPKRRSNDDLEYALDRICFITSRVIEYVRAADLVVIEGLAFASHTGKATERAGLWWRVVAALDHRDIPVAVMAPTARAKYACGKGNAGKDEVMLAVARRFPSYGISGNDMADALALCAAGYDHLGHALIQLPAAHRDALRAVAWPERTTA